MSFRKLRWSAIFVIAALLISACNIGATPPPTQDVAALQTQAVAGVFTQAALQSTQTAAAVPPTPLPTFTLAPTKTLPAIPTSAEIATNTPFTFNTQQPGLTPQAGLASTATSTGPYSTVVTKNGCSDGYLISESAPYDGKKMNTRTEFTKSWEFLNTGTCDWDGGFVFAFVEGVFDSCNGPKYVVPKDYVFPKSTIVKPGQTLTITIKMVTPKEPGDYKWCFKMKDDAGQFFGSLVWTQLIVE